MKAWSFRSNELMFIPPAFRPAPRAARHRGAVIYHIFVARARAVSYLSRQGGSFVKLLTLSLLFVACAACAAAQPSADLEKEKAELLRLHKLAREAHFQTDVDRLLENSPEEMISVSRGKINRSGKADARKMFAGYFRGAKYYEWDDVEEPIIRVSKDASMAWMITRIRVRRVQPDAAGVEKEEKFVYAGIMTYEKRDGRWARVANVSTFEQPN